MDEVTGDSSLETVFLELEENKGSQETKKEMSNERAAKALIKKQLLQT